MKRILAFILAAIMLISLSSCKKNKYDPLPEGMETGGSKEQNVTVKAESDFDVPLPEELTFDYDMSKYITLPDYKSPDFVYDKLSTDQNAIETDIKHLKLNSSKATISEADRAARDGDLVIFDYTSVFESNGEKAISGQGINLIIGSEMFAPGFDSYIKGIEKDQTISFNFTFPESWSATASIAGKTLTFTVKASSVSAVVLPDISTILQEQGVSTEEELKELLVQNREEANRYYFFEAIVAQSELIAFPEKEYSYCVGLFEADIEARAKMYGAEREAIISSEYGSLEAFNKAKKESADNKCKRFMVAYYLQDIYGFELSKNEYNLCLAEYLEENGSSMGLKTLEETHTNMGVALANSLFNDLAAKAAYGDK